MRGKRLLGGAALLAACLAGGCCNICERWCGHHHREPICCQPCVPVCCPAPGPYPVAPSHYPSQQVPWSQPRSTTFNPCCP